LVVRGDSCADVGWAAHRLLPLTYEVPPEIRTWGGAALTAVGACVFIGCLDTFIRHGRGTQLPTEAPRRLVTNGLFAVVRNPIILAELMVIWGEAIYVASLGMALYALVASVGGLAIVRYVEEPELRRRFGASYDTYCQNVPFSGGCACDAIRYQCPEAPMLSMRG
jgi:protein-S-isoprenylcysteine O-methyltransferase Ste14